MCRQYNDYGFISRDRIEGNLNSVNFPEFHAGNRGLGAGKKGKVKRKVKKEGAWRRSEYEREVLRRARQALEKRVKMREMRLIDVFVGVTDLYGHIYVAGDIASRMS